ncbi:MAG: hypothetical protein WD059_13830 [Balneolaceae bacterium]
MHEVSRGPEHVNYQAAFNPLHHPVLAKFDNVALCRPNRMMELPPNPSFRFPEALAVL